MRNAFLDMQEHGRRPQNVLLRLATAYAKLETIYVPTNLHDADEVRFRNVIFYHLRVKSSSRWGFLVLPSDPLPGDQATQMVTHLVQCQEKLCYPIFKLRVSGDIVCVYDKTVNSRVF